MYICNGILPGHKKDEILSYVTWMDLKDYTKLNKPEREIQILYNVSYMWNNPI